MDKTRKKTYIFIYSNDETIMKTFSQNKKRLLVGVFLAVALVFTTTASIAMPLYMDSSDMNSNECTQIVCEKCCLISVPELSGLQYEYSFSSYLDGALSSKPDSTPLPFEHPPQ
jgi:hypothetical protein